MSCMEKEVQERNSSSLTSFRLRKNHLSFGFVPIHPKGYMWEKRKESFTRDVEFKSMLKFPTDQKPWDPISLRRARRVEARLSSEGWLNHYASPCLGGGSRFCLFGLSANQWTPVLGDLYSVMFGFEDAIGL